MPDRLHVSARHRRVLEALLREHLPDVEVWAYGSRVNGRSHDGSDLDLVLRGPGLEEVPLDLLMDFEDAVRESTIPFLVEARDWARLPERFHREIEREYVVVAGESDSSGEPHSASRLCDHADVVMGQSPPGVTCNTAGEGMPLLNGPTQFGSHHPTPAQFTVDPRRQATAGDLLFCVRGSTTGRMNWADRDYAIGRGVAAIRHRAGPELQPFVRGVVEQSLPDLLLQATGSTFPNVSGKQLATIAWPNLGLRKQRAIAHILGTLDDRIELNRRMNQTLEAMARALFKSWFVDLDPVRAKMKGRDTGLPSAIADLFPDRLVDSEMGEVPEGWEVVALPERIEVNPRRSLRRGQAAPYLPMSKMPTHGHMPESVALRPFGSGMRFANGDTLVARITPCLENGKTAYVDFLNDAEIGWGSTEYIVLRPQSPLPNQFAYCLARSARFREFAIQNMSGTSGRQRVPATALRGFLMVVPPGRLAARFGEVVGSLFERAKCTGRESRTLAALRDTLLPKLISGALRVPRSERGLFA